MGISKISQCRKQPACYHQAIESPFGSFIPTKGAAQSSWTKIARALAALAMMACPAENHDIRRWLVRLEDTPSSRRTPRPLSATVALRLIGGAMDFHLFYLRRPETVCSRFPEAQIRVKTQIVWFNMVDERRCAWMAIRSWLVRSQHQSTAIWSDHHNVTLTEGLSINMEIVVSCVD